LCIAYQRGIVSPTSVISVAAFSVPWRRSHPSLHFFLYRSAFTAHYHVQSENVSLPPGRNVVWMDTSLKRQVILDYRLDGQRARKRTVCFDKTTLWEAIPLLHSTDRACSRHACMIIQSYM
jgi:hypothetical protein